VRDFPPINTRRGAEQHKRQVRQSLQEGTFGKEQSTKEVPTLANFEAQYLEYAELHNKPGTDGSPSRRVFAGVVSACLPLGRDRRVTVRAIVECDPDCA